LNTLTAIKLCVVYLFGVPVILSKYRICMQA